MSDRIIQTRHGPEEYKVTHRPRVTRRMHLEIDDSGGLVVVIPNRWPLGQVQGVLQANCTRVERFLVRAREKQRPCLKYMSAESHMFAGHYYSLMAGPAQAGLPVVSLDESNLNVNAGDGSPNAIKAALQGWYLRRAKAVFPDRLAHIVANTPWASGQSIVLKYRRMKRTWGTCRKDGTIRLNTHLVKAPLEYLDYVIGHELCHLQEMNHGPAFYRLQDSVTPQWRTLRTHLREQGQIYTRE